MITTIKKLIPGFLKPVLRYAVSPVYRKHLKREKGIISQQDMNITGFDGSAKKLIIFLVPGANIISGKDEISGGVISIVSLCEESAALKEVHGAEVVLCTFPKALLLLKHTQFDNHTNVYRFSQVPEYFVNCEEIIIHLPELYVTAFNDSLSSRERDWLRSRKFRHLNILNQSIQLMPAPEVVTALNLFFDLVTITTAHQQYCNEHYRKYYNVPLHKFSVWISPEKYTSRNFAEKENLVIVSPDEHPLKQHIIEKLNTAGLKAQVIRNLTYRQYKEVINRAKWSITFGEGLDGYFIEPVFSGAISFAVYNTSFFTPEFKNLNTVFESYEQMSEELIGKMSAFDNEEIYNEVQGKEYALCSALYSHATYLKNIELFYKKEYTYR